MTDDILANFDKSALSRSIADFARPSGPDLFKKTEPFFSWVSSLRQRGLWLSGRELLSAPGPTAKYRIWTGDVVDGINFGSQDYLALSSHPQIHEAAIRALKEFGPHSAGSPVLSGTHRLLKELERALADYLHMEYVNIYPTGWGAGYASTAGLVKRDDHIVMDVLAHNCLTQGAFTPTKNVLRFEHLNIAEARQHLQAIRSRDARNSILVVTEGLFSMDADWPDIQELQALCHEFGAYLLVDIAHDLGALGPGGTGSIGAQKMLGKVDLIMGSFSKTFASNGGFIATNSPAVNEYFKFNGGTFTFSNSLSPIQAGIVLEAVKIVRSKEGDELRDRLMRSINEIREEFSKYGIQCHGNPSPIVPVPIGEEEVARIAYCLTSFEGVFAHIIEFPAVAIGNARYRVQVMPTHTSAMIKKAVQVLAESINKAGEILKTHLQNEWAKSLNKSLECS